MFASAKAVWLLAEDVGVTADETTWLDAATAPELGTPDATAVTVGVTAGGSEATVWVLAEVGATAAGEVVSTTDVADGPRVGKFGSAKGCDGVPP